MTSARSRSAARSARWPALSKNEVLSAIIHGRVPRRDPLGDDPGRQLQMTGKRVFRMAPLHHHFEKGYGRDQDRHSLLDRLGAARRHRARVSQTAVRCSRVLLGRSSSSSAVGWSGAGAAKLLLSSAAPPCWPSMRTRAQTVDHPRLRVKTGRSPRSTGRAPTAVVVSPGVPLSKSEIVAARMRACPSTERSRLAYRTLPGARDRCSASPAPTARAPPPRCWASWSRGARRTPSWAATSAPRSRSRTRRPIEAVRPARHRAGSSFQLEGCVDARFRGSAILNLTPDHLDRYPTTRRTARQRRLFDASRRPATSRWSTPTTPTCWCSRLAKVPVRVHARRAAHQPGFAGLAVGRGQVHLHLRRCDALHGEEPRAARRSQPAERDGGFADGAPRRHSRRRDPEGARRSPACRTARVRPRERKGVEWINDSKATNVDERRSWRRRRSGKRVAHRRRKGGAPYQPLVDAAKGKVKGVLTIGRTRRPSLTRGARSVHDCGAIAPRSKKAAGATRWRHRCCCRRRALPRPVQQLRAPRRCLQAAGPGALADE